MPATVKVQAFFLALHKNILFMSTYYLLLGSNQGDRENNLKNAHTQIEKMIGKINKKSSVYETEPWGLENQDNFLNMVIAVRSDLKPRIVQPCTC